MAEPEMPTTIRAMWCRRHEFWEFDDDVMAGCIERGCRCTGCRCDCPQIEVAISPVKTPEGGS